MTITRTNLILGTIMLHDFVQAKGFLAELIHGTSKPNCVLRLGVPSMADSDLIATITSAEWRGWVAARR